MTPVKLTINRQFRHDNTITFGGADAAEALRALRAWLDNNYTRVPEDDRQFPAVKVETPDGPRFTTLHFNHDRLLNPWQVDAVDPESGRRAEYKFIKWEQAREEFIDQAAAYGRWEGNDGR